MLNTLKANSVCYMVIKNGIVTDTNSCHIYTDMLFFNTVIPHWDDAHMWWGFLFFLLRWYSENTITTCVHTKNWYWWWMWWKWLVQMHAPSLEAVNPITLFSPSSICSQKPFFPSGDPQWGAWTHLHTKRLEINTEQEISIIRLSSQTQWWTSLLSPSVISSSADNEAISICEAYVSQVSRMAQKAFVFGLKRTFFFHSQHMYLSPVIKLGSVIPQTDTNTLMLFHRHHYVVPVE